MEWGLILASEWVPLAMPRVALVSRACLSASLTSRAPSRFVALREDELKQEAVRTAAAAAAARAPARVALEEALDIFVVARAAVERACLSAIDGGRGGVEHDIRDEDSDSDNDDAIPMSIAREHTDLFLTSALNPGVVACFLVSEAEAAIAAAAAVAMSADAPACVEALRRAHANARALSEAAEPFEIAATCAAESWLGFCGLRALRATGESHLLDVPYSELVRDVVHEKRQSANRAARICALRLRASKVVSVSTFNDRFAHACNTGNILPVIAGVNALLCGVSQAPSDSSDLSDPSDSSDSSSPPRAIVWLVSPPVFPRPLALDAFDALDARETLAALDADPSAIVVSRPSACLAAAHLSGSRAIAPLVEAARFAVTAQDAILVVLN